MTVAYYCTVVEPAEHERRCHQLQGVGWDDGAYGELGGGCDRHWRRRRKRILEFGHLQLITSSTKQQHSKRVDSTNLNSVEFLKYFVAHRVRDKIN